MLPGTAGKKTFKTLRKRPLDAVNALLEAQKVPREFSRRMRGLSDGLKAEEHRNVGLYWFPLLLEEMNRKEDKDALAAWTRWAFIMRAYTCPDKEHADLSPDLLDATVTKFMKSFIHAFGRDACTYNFHHALHLRRMREQAPLTEISAVPYESSFAMVRRCIVPGTENIPKQILKSTYLRLAKSHYCKKKVIVCKSEAIWFRM